MPFDWRRPAVVGASFGVTVVVAIVGVIAIFHWYSSRPQSWDASTIQGISTTVSQTFTLDEKKKTVTASGFTLAFILENTSGRDYTAPENLRFFKRSRKNGALEELDAKLEHSFVVPAKEKTEVHASVEYGCSNEDLETGKTSDRDGPTCFKDAFGAAGQGQAWHHVVEQSINSGKFAPQILHNPANLLKLPHGAGSIHAKISGYYSSKVPGLTGDLTVREWLSKKSFKEQFDFGIDAIKKAGGSEYLPPHLR